jgi:hypothetical protein
MPIRHVRFKPAARPWRRFLRFSVRGMIVLVLLVGGWLGWIVRGARKPRTRIAEAKGVSLPFFGDR